MSAVKRGDDDDATAKLLNNIIIYCIKIEIRLWNVPFSRQEAKVYRR